LDALVMAGGLGSRMNIGEKPLLEIKGKPMIAYVLETMLNTKGIDRVFVASSPRALGTKAWVEREYKDVKTVSTPGEGYVRDMVYAVEEAGIQGPVLVIMADLPLIKPWLIEKIMGRYFDAGKPALSVHLSLSFLEKLGLRPETVFHKNEEPTTPAGINILDADKIREEQEDYNYILEEPELAFNVNTLEDLKACQEFLSKAEEE